MGPFLTPPLNQKFSATPKICLKLCSKILIKFLNFHFEVAQNRGVLIFLGGSTADQPMNMFQNKGSIYPYTSYTDSNRSHEFVRIKNVAQKLLNPGVIQTLTQ